MKRQKLLISLGLGAYIFLAASPLYIFADYPKVAPGDSITLGEFIYDDNYVATTSPCTITIVNPSGVPVVSDAVTSAEVTGWHSYAYTVPSNGPNGSWPAILTCGSEIGGDLIRGDKTFLVDGVYLASSSTIATSVWSSLVRRLTDETLTGGGSIAKQSDVQSASSSLSGQITAGTNSVIASVSSASSSLSGQIQTGITTTLSASSSLSGQIATTNANVLLASSTLGSAIASVSSLISALNNLSASDVWSYGSRSLSTFGTLAADVWTSTTRTLTGAGLTSGSLATTADVTSASSSLSGQITATNNNVLSASSSLSGQILANGILISSASSSLSTQVTTANNNILSASSTLGGLIAALNNVSVAQIWGYATRTLTGAGLTSGSLATLADVSSSEGSIRSSIQNATTTILSAVSGVDTKVSNASSSLSSQILANGVLISTTNNNIASASTSLSGQIATTNANVVSASTTLGGMLATISGLITGLNNISVSDIWNNPTRTLTSFGTLASDIQSNVNANTDARIGQATSTILTSVSSASSSLSGQVLGVSTSIASASSSLSGQIASTNASVLSASSSLSGQVATANSNILSASSTLGSLIAALNNLSAAQVWAYASRTLTGAGLTSGSLATLSDITSASSSLSGQIQTGNTAISAVDAKITSASSSLSSQILANGVLINTANTNILSASSSLSGQVATTNANVLSASSTLGTRIASLSSLISALNNISVSDVWNYGTRSLTSFGTLASDIQTNINGNTDARIGQATSTIVTAITSASSSLSGQIQTISSPTGTWSVTLSNTESITTGKTYRAKLYTSRAGSPSNTFATPLVTLYDSSRNVIVSSIPMTNLGTGIYEYTYSVPTNAAQGAWETVIDTETESGLHVQNNDFWQVAGAPAQVIINSISGLTTPNISANVTITNEGLSGYEYHYEWCVVNDSNNACGDGDDTYHATAAKFINPGEDFNTTLTATVPDAGNYYFKMIVYFGTESSGSSRSFTAVAPTNSTPSPSPSGGGGGGSPFVPSSTATSSGALLPCNGADLNRDNKINLTDFSIMMAFWKTKAPFKNPCVDINQDTRVDSKDFSLLLAQWNTRGTPYVSPKK
jgi:hypothetical protein